MPKPALLACVVLICSLNSFAADRKTTSFADLPSEAQASIKAAMQRNIATENFTLTASDGVDSDQFGLSVAIDGSTVVVGAFQVGQAPGAAYVFVKPANGWANMTQIAELTASDAQAGDCFACSVAISRSTIVVGSAGHEVNGNLAEGAAYVYVEPAQGWTNMTETAELTASDGVPDTLLGNSVAIDGSTVIAGAPGVYPVQGKAYVFEEPEGGWVDTTQTAEFLPSDAFNYDNFGFSVSISGGTVLVGAPDLSIGSPEVGRGYIFVEPPGGWVNMTQTAELMASDGKIGNGFGFSVATEDSTAIIGAPGHLSGGAVYVFVEPQSGWKNKQQTATLLSGSNDGSFGWSSSIDGSVVIGGAPNVSASRGAAFVFVRPSGGWRSSSKPTLELSIPFTYKGDSFGVSVAISGTTGVVGAPSGADVSPLPWQ